MEYITRKCITEKENSELKPTVLYWKTDLVSQPNYEVVEELDIYKL